MIMFEELLLYICFILNKLLLELLFMLVPRLFHGIVKNLYEISTSNHIPMLLKSRQYGVCSIIFVTCKSKE